MTLYTQYILLLLSREYRRGNQKWTIQRCWKKQHNMCWTPLYTYTYMYKHK